MRNITFTLVVDNFGVKYVDKTGVKHLISSIKSNYGLTGDWTGNLYCEISLDWDYVNRWVDISMPGYIRKNCRNTTTSFQHICKSVCTHLNHFFLDPKPKLLFLPMNHLS